MKTHNLKYLIENMSEWISLPHNTNSTEIYGLVRESDNFRNKKTIRESRK